MKIENAVVLVTGANRGIGQAFAPVLKANGGGSLLNVLSVASWVNGGQLAAQVLADVLTQQVKQGMTAPTPSYLPKPA